MPTLAARSSRRLSRVISSRLAASPPMKPPSSRIASLTPISPVTIRTALFVIPQYLKALKDGHLKTGVPLTVLKQTAAVLACDGNWGLGQVQAHRLLQKLVPLAKAVGVAAGTLYQCGHIGRLGEYAETATASGLRVLRVGQQSRFRPHGRAAAAASKDASAPIRCAWPCRPRNRTKPSCWTSAPAFVRKARCASPSTRVNRFRKAGSSTPKGNPTTDPTRSIRNPPGTILPLGGKQAYKGFGIGLLLDMLVGGLSGAPCSRPEIGPRTANAILFLLFDNAHFAGGEHFRKEVSDLAANVRRSKPKAGATVTLPGDPERRRTARRSAAGITLDEGTWKQLTTLATELRVTLPG